MILGIGIDIVEVERFTKWENYSIDRLKKVFSDVEIALSPKQYAREYYASRFAAKEAFFKALSSALISLDMTKQPFSFNFARQHIEVVKGIWDVPRLNVNWHAFKKKIENKLPSIFTNLSFSHERCFTVAMVVLSCHSQKN